MKCLSALLLLVSTVAWPLAASADCPSQCVFDCSKGPAEEYAKCLDKCLAGCPADPVPAPSPPAPVPSTPTAPTEPAAPKK